MIHRSAVIWAKLSLLIGAGLLGVIAIEVGYKAFGVHDQAAEEAIAPSPAAPAPDQVPTPPAEAIMDDAPQNDSLTTKTAPVELSAAPTSQSSASLPSISSGPAPVFRASGAIAPSNRTANQFAPSSTADSKTLAINSAPDDGTIDPSITNLTPEEFAIAAWAGASFPVENFQAYTSPFGYRRSATGGYRQEFHYGLDIASPQGSYIRSWWSGNVVEVSDNTNCGTSVVVQSGEWMHIYCHMQGHVETQNGRKYMIDRSAGLQIWQGQEIVAGDRIGRVGMTGRTTGPHLHWGLKYQGNWVDPAWVLRAMAMSQHAVSGE